MKQKILPIGAATLLCLMILDNHCVLEGAKSGIEICYQVVIPSLFPLIFAASLFVTTIDHGASKGFSWLNRLFGFPSGKQHLLLTGFLGGYPVGARMVGEAVKSEEITLAQGTQMVFVCNAAGPAFIFGMAGKQFTQHWVPWTLWFVYILAALITAQLLPVASPPPRPVIYKTPFSITKLLRNCLQGIMEICGWIIIFRVLITIMEKRVLWLLPHPVEIFIVGLLEMSNGCILLDELTSTGWRFLLFSVFISFGGICVFLQSHSSAPKLISIRYAIYKLLQSVITFLLAYPLQRILLPPQESAVLPAWSLMVNGCFAILLSLLFRKTQNKCRNSFAVSV